MVTEADLDRAAALLRGGGLVALPTETVYGLGANALDPEAVARIYEVKGRPSTSPLIVHVASVEMAIQLASQWPDAAAKLAAAFWPGPLTLVVPKNPIIPDAVTAGLPTVGLRMPSHPLILEVIRRAGIPIAAPSANRFTGLSPTTAEHVRESLGDAADMILDGGPCTVGIESTVVSAANDTPVLLRPGMISLDAIQSILGQSISVAGAVEGAHPSPGMHERHYSPRTPLMLITDGVLPKGRVAYLWRKSPIPATLEIPMPADSVGYARELYDALHRADQAGMDWIAVEAPPDDPQWFAIRDRLQRAAR